MIVRFPRGPDFSEGFFVVFFVAGVDGGGI